MTGCSIKGCRNRTEYFRTHFTGNKVSYHTFPKDENVCTKWIKACGAENINVNIAKICSDHFLPTAYRKIIRSRRLVPSSQYRRLKEDAIPTEKLPRVQMKSLQKCPDEGTNPTTKGVDEGASVSHPINMENIVDLVDDENPCLPVYFPRENRMEIIHFTRPKPVNINSELARFLLENTADNTVQKVGFSTTRSEDSENIKERIASTDANSITNISNEKGSGSAKNNVQSSRSVQNLQEDVPYYEEEIKKLKEENNILKRKLREKDKQLLTTETIKKKYKTMLESVFTPKEIKVLMKNVKQGTKKWCAEDIV